MRKATIDLDWLNAEIEEYEELRDKNNCQPEEYYKLSGIVAQLDIVRSKCEPIEEVKEPLPTKCLIGWLDSKYCHNENQCLICKTK